jgi:hypothetical protein
MGYLGCLLFGLFFLLIAPGSREALAAKVGVSTEWIHIWAPFSYVLIGLLLMGPFVGIAVLKCAPKIEEPENPLAKYKREHIDVD